jgi:hypothetical protein
VSAIEKKILDKVRQLDIESQQRVLEYIESIEAPAITIGEWLERIDALREQLDAKYGPNHFPSAADIIEEMREERLNDILGSL